MGSLATLGSGFTTHFPYGVVQNPVVAAGSADALPVRSGEVFVTKAGVDAMTLALPTAGDYPSGVANSIGNPRDDGKELLIVSTTAFAHTITTPATGVNKTLHLLTFAGAVGNWVKIKAFAATWYVIGSSGVTAS